MVFVQEIGSSSNINIPIVTHQIGAPVILPTNSLNFNSPIEYLSLEIRASTSSQNKEQI